MKSINILLLFLSGLVQAQIQVSLPMLVAEPGDGLEVPILVDEVTGEGILSFTCQLQYDAGVVELNNALLQGGLAQGWSLSVNSQPGLLRLSAAGTRPLSGLGALIRVTGSALANGVSDLTLSDFAFNEGLPDVQIQQGQIVVSDGTTGPIFHVIAGDVRVHPYENFSLSLQLEHPGEGEVFSFDGVISFDPTLITLDSVSLEGSLIEDWNLVINTNNSGQLVLSAAGSVAIGSSGTLLTLQGTGRNLGTSPISLQDFTFNEGTPELETHNGQVIVTDQNIPGPLVSMGSVEVTTGQNFSMPLFISELDSAQIQALSFQLEFNPQLCRFTDYQVEGHLLEGWSIAYNTQTNGQLQLSAAGATALPAEGILLHLEGEALASGQTALLLQELELNEGLPLGQTQNGHLAISDNRPPSVLITAPEADLVVSVEETVQFAGVAQDPDMHYPLHWNWSFGGGFSNRNDSLPFEIPFSRAGTYRVELTVSDSLGLSARSMPRFVTVVEGSAPDGIINLPLEPILAVLPGTSIQFHGTAVDDDGETAFTYQWQIGDQQTSTLATPTPVIFNRLGDHLVRFTVTDGSGLRDPTPAQCIIRVTTSLPPQSSIQLPIQDTLITVGSSVSFAGSGSSPSGSILNYYWDFDGVAPPSRLQNPGSIRFPSLGTYQVSLNVRDLQGDVDPTPAIRRITVVESLPSASIISPAADLVIQPNQGVLFQGVGSGLGALAYEWDFDGGAPTSYLRNPGLVHFAIPGSYLVTLNVRDQQGYLDPHPPQRRITVSGNQPPRGYIQEPSIDLTILAGETLSFNGFGEDADGHYPLSYRWDFDGVVPPVFGPSAQQVIFPNPGVYTISFTVSDNLGSSDTTPALRTITVIGDEPVPIIVTPAINSVVYQGESLYFRGIVDAEERQQPLAILWRFDGAAPENYSLEPGAVVFENPGDYLVTFEASDRFGYHSSSPETRLIRVMPCPLAILSSTEPQGLSPITLQVAFPCPLSGQVSWYWTQLSDGISFGHNQNPYQLNSFLTSTSDFSFTLEQNAQLALQRKIRILVPYQARFEDFNEDGINSMQDWYAALPYWQSLDHDADGDGIFSIIDLSYICTRDGN